MSEDVIDALNVRVTEAIGRAERLADETSPHATGAYAEVSSYEEALAALLPADDIEGAVARVGAVTAALRAGDLGRARDLAARFKRDDALSDGRKAEIDEAFATLAPQDAPTNKRTTSLLRQWRVDVRRQFEEAA